jgi:acyl-coenzyme A thioesterase PaaI-like protein
MAATPRPDPARRASRRGAARPTLHPAPLDRCVICGPRRRGGLRVRFRRRGNAVVTSFTPGPAHQGYEGLMSGGLLAAIFDCLHYRLAVVSGVILAVTARIEVDYRAPVPLGRPVRFEARLIARRGRVFDSRATARLADGTVVADSRAVYVEVPAIVSSRASQSPRSASRGAASTRQRRSRIMVRRAAAS